MNKEDCMIRATRLHPTVLSDLDDEHDKAGLIGVYNRGQSDMYDYLANKFTNLYIRHMVSDYEKPNLFVLMDFFNEFKNLIK